MHKTAKGCILLLVTVSACAAIAGEAPSGLLCELLAHPQLTTISDATPDFGWIVNSDVNDNAQKAYQIMVATDKALLQQGRPDKWDSGKVSSADSLNITYAGSALGPNESCFWKVRTWDKTDKPSPWSAVQQFISGPSLSGYATARYKQQKSEITPASVKQIGQGHYLIDFGADAFGYIRWRPSQQKSQTDVTVHFGEKLDNNAVDRHPGGTIRYYKTMVSLDGSAAYEIHPPGTKTGTPIPAEFGRIAPFRYVEIENSPCDISTADIRQISIHYPFDDNAASFHCENETLNRVWRLCHYSIKATSFCAVYVDGDRERRPYEADAYLNQLSHYCVDREFSLARYSHEYLLAHPTWPTEWKHHSIMIAWADYLYTGNSESLAQNYDTLKGKLLADHARADGLLVTNDLRDIVDWPAGERDGYVFKPVNTVVNAFYYHTLNLMKQIAEVLGRTDDAQRFGRDAARVHQSFQSVLFNPQTGLYVDGEGTTHSALHANMMPLAFGLVPDANKKTVVDFLESKGMACSVYGAQYLLEALYRAGDESTALDLLTSDGPRSWVNMMREGSTITMEAWGKKYKPNLDWNHAWGAAPANIIPRFVVGIRPMEPGFRKALIHPQPATITQMQATIPTIRGPISVSMDARPAANTFALTIPANMTARFVLPENCKAFETVMLDGKQATVHKQGSTRFIDPVPSGRHTVICR